MIIDKKKKIFFKKNGYLILRKIISKNKIKNIKDSLIDYLYFKKIIKKKKVGTRKIDNVLIDLRKKNKKKFGELFDSFQTLGLANFILTEKKILKAVSKLLDTNFNNLTFTDMSLRLDAPHDKRNSLGWHQDSSYFRQNSNGNNGIVLWTPLNSLNYELGPIEFLEKSFTAGTLSIKKKQTRKKNTSAQRIVPKKIILKYNKLIKNILMSGDIILLNLNMIHRSGLNKSKKMRISLQGRYHKMLSEDFNSGLNKYIYSDRKLNTSIHGKI